ncbi:transferrin-a precursor [Danio rerio]|uniref:Serotransferrin n=2 Tax=Danio rerio TaxID=7955 RepID=B8JL43_DANRE|nr:transferrin-a precursor [Danio rerio]|eukprot:NP_001278428.1 serotransferrin precursor [Danio rerio]
MKVLLISLLGCLVVALPSASAQKKVKWCVTTQNEQSKCRHLATKAADIECHLQPTVIDCMRSIAAGGTDIVTVDGANVFTGGLNNYLLRPIIAEKKKECCYAVAAVKAGSGFNINELKGKSSCHSCYQRSGGWNTPIGKLIATNKITWEGPNEMPVERAVSEFFSSSCVPGVSKPKYPNLCKACQGDCSCSHNEKYFGDDGAFQCLKNDNGQVAFVCHHAIPESERQNYELLCMDGSRKSVEDYKTCNFAREPARTVIARTDTDLQYVYDVLKQIPASDLFSSQAFGGKDLIFSDSATELMLLPKRTDSLLYLKEEYYEAMQAFKDGNPSAPTSQTKLAMCTIGHAEKNKCDSLDHVKKSCILEASVDDCIEKIKRKEADFLAVDGGQVYIAGKCGLVPVMAEQSNSQSCSSGSGGTASYYAVAVVRKGSGLTWNNLEGKKSCHTGLGRSAGWKIPESAICGEKDKCTLDKFFSEGCAPGADPTSNMCKLCKGSGKPVGDESKCKPSAEEQYYGYDGAFRCLAEKAGDVAFIKHTVVGDYTDGKGKDWAKDLKSEDFELICPNTPDTTMKYTDFEKCNLAQVPVHAVITREDARSAVVSFLSDIQSKNNDLFTSKDGKNLLFTDGTKCLQEIKGSVDDFLTKKYIDMIERTYKTSQNVPDLVKACTFGNCISS